MGHDDVRQEIEILYIDLGGDMSKHRILPLRIRFSTGLEAAGGQWLLEAREIDTGCERSFVLKDIQTFLPTASMATPF